MYSNQFDEESKVNEDKKSDSSTPAISEYEFEGFRIEVNEKIMLTPLTQKK